MPLTILTDAQIKDLLESLTVAELDGFQASLAVALAEHSSAAASVHQPERTSIRNEGEGTTTLFMPCGSDGLGMSVKVVTLTSATPPPTTTSTTTKKPTISATGGITLFSPTGQPLALLHAATLTAFRTALASLPLVRARTRIHRIATFGLGGQALWHLRLALLARSSDVQQITIFTKHTKSPDTIDSVIDGLRGVVKGDGVEEKNKIDIKIIAAEDHENAEGYADIVRASVGDADVIFCCSTGKEVLFENEWLSHKGVNNDVRGGKLVVAVGSYTPEMREVPAGLVRDVVAGKSDGSGLLVVDTVEGVLSEAGELIGVGVGKGDVVELGTLLGGAASMPDVLRDGHVLYKSVGMGLMDLATGMHLVGHARTKKVGAYIEEF